MKSDCTLTSAGPYGHCLLGVGQVVRLSRDQVDPGPEDQHHSNRLEVQLGYSRAAPHIASSLNLFSGGKDLGGSPLENLARLA